MLDSTADVGKWSRITIGADGFPLIAYNDEDATTLKSYHCTTATCSAGVATTIDPAVNTGTHLDITTGSDGFGIISYIESSNQELWVAHCTTALCNSATLTAVHSSVVGGYTSIVIGTDNLALISFYDTENGNLMLVHCTNTACTTSDTAVTLDADAGNVGTYTSIAIAANQRGIIACRDEDLTTLYVAHCDDADCSTATLVSIDSVGPQPGVGISIAIGADGLGLISEVARGTLRVVSDTECVINECTSGTHNCDSDATYECMYMISEQACWHKAAFEHVHTGVSLRVICTGCDRVRC